MCGLCPRWYSPANTVILVESAGNPWAMRGKKRLRVSPWEGLFAGCFKSQQKREK